MFVENPFVWSIANLSLQSYVATASWNHIRVVEGYFDEKREIIVLRKTESVHFGDSPRDERVAAFKKILAWVTNL
jgi:hypothetical protein